MSNPLDLTGLMPAMEQMLLLDTVRVSAPSSGNQALDVVTGELSDDAPAVLYEGIGAIFPSGTHPPQTAPYALQAYQDNPRSVFRLFTPVSAIVVPRDALVRVVRATYDSALVGRVWRALDEGLPSSQIVLRETWLQLQKPPGSP